MSEIIILKTKEKRKSIWPTLVSTYVIKTSAINYKMLKELLAQAADIDPINGGSCTNTTRLLNADWKGRMTYTIFCFISHVRTKNKMYSKNAFQSKKIKINFSILLSSFSVNKDFNSA